MDRIRKSGGRIIQGDSTCLLSKNKTSRTVTDILNAGTGPKRSLPHTVFGGHNLTVQDGSAPLSLIFLECVLTEMAEIFGEKKKHRSTLSSERGCFKLFSSQLCSQPD